MDGWTDGRTDGWMDGWKILFIHGDLIQNLTIGAPLTHLWVGHLNGFLAPGEGNFKTLISN